jgi:branched-chain amino acid aminotransferase
MHPGTGAASRPEVRETRGNLRRSRADGKWRKDMEKRHPKYLFKNGEIIPYEESTVHVLSTALKYAAVVFEGIRAYWNEEQGELYIFRLRDHLERLFRSIKIVRMESPYTLDEFEEHLVELIRRNELREDLHIRIQVLVEEDNGGLASTGPIGVAMAAMPLGRYVGKKGLHCCVSSWVRIADDSFPARVKCIANYHNARLALLQARVDGYDDAILLDRNGKVTEGPGYNLFIVRDGVLTTCPTTYGILEGVTRATLMELFRELYNLPVTEREIDKTELYIAEEAFFCGSGAEVIPIFSIDRHRLSDDKPGPLTSLIRKSYYDIVRGKNPYRDEWLKPIYSSGS